MTKQISKLIAVLLICIIAFSGISVYASKGTDYVSGTGIVPGTFGPATENDPVTRGEFAYIMAGLMTTDELKALDTSFTDVTKSDYFSGQVEFLAQMGIAGGYGDGTFGKDDPVTLETAYIFLMRVLEYTGYITNHSEVQGKYTDLAYKIGLKPGKFTNEEGYVTRKGAAEMAYDALTVELSGVHYKVVNGQPQISKDPSIKSNIMASVLGISVYDGVISDVDVVKNRLTFTVTKNLYDKNPVVLSKGDELAFAVGGNISAYEYSNLPVTVWVDEEGNLVYISVKKDVEVRFATIYSVNGDKAENAYGVSSIERVMLYNDEEEYTVSDDATFRANGEDITGRYAYAQKFARVIIEKDEIVHIESWDLVEGGIVDAVEETEIRYTEGPLKKAIRRYDEYKTKIYIINGEVATNRELTLGTIIYYYANLEDDYLVIVGSNEVISAPLEGTRNNELLIGNTIVSFGDNFYYENNIGGYSRYTSASDIKDFYGRRVSAHMAPTGRILYLKNAIGSVITTTEFYGAVTGIEEDRRDSEKVRIQAWVLNDAPTKEIFETTEKTVYEDGLTLETVGRSANKLDASGIYKFKLNSKGLITNISKPDDFYGFGGPVVTDNGTFYSPSGGRGYITFNSRAIYFDNIVHVLYQIDGQLMVGTCKWSELHTKDGTGTQTRIFGEGTSSVPSLVVLSGDVSKFGSSSGEGILIGRNLVIDEEGELGYKLKVRSAAGDNEFVVKKAYGESLKLDTYIGYTGNTRFSDGEIFIRKTWDISGPSDTWVDDSTTNTMIRGRVELIDENRAIFTDGSIAYFAPQGVNVLVADLLNTRRQYYTGSLDDIAVGDVVYYYTSQYGVSSVMLVKDVLTSDPESEESTNIYQQIYVAPYGNDDEGDGSETSPYATIGRAKRKVAEINSGMTGDIIVNVLSGEYKLEETEVFGVEHGGKNGYNVIFKGFDKADPPLISGGQKVTGWEPYSDGIWSAPLTGVDEVRNLYVNEIPASRARTKYTYRVDGTDVGDLNGFLVKKRNFPESIARPQDLEIGFTYDWENVRIPLDGLEDASDKYLFTSSAPTWDSWAKAKNNIKAYFENAMEFLDEPGEFYYNPQEQRIYYYPYEEENMRIAVTYVGDTEKLIKIYGDSNTSKVENLVFDNLKIMYGAWNFASEYGYIGTQSDGVNHSGIFAGQFAGQIELDNADNVTFRNCEIACLGSAAINLSDSVSNMKITGNIIRDISGTGIKVGEVNHNLPPAGVEQCTNISIENNIVTRTGGEFYNNCGISVIYATNVDILHNVIKDIPYSGISLGWGWASTLHWEGGGHDVSYNRIENTMIMTRDGGGIYTLGKQHGTRIYSNYIKNHDSWYDGALIYHDAGTQNIEDYNNVLEDAGWYVCNPLQGYEARNLYFHDNYAINSTERYDAGEYPAEDNVRIEDATIVDADNIPEHVQAIIDNSGLTTAYDSLETKATFPTWRAERYLYYPDDTFKGTDTTWGILLEAEDFDPGAEGETYYAGGSNKPNNYREERGFEYYNLPNMDSPVLANFLPYTWTTYTFTVTEAGTYNIDYRAMSYCTYMPDVEIYIDDVKVASPWFGGDKVYKTVTTEDAVTLTAGTHKLKLYSRYTHHVDHVRLYTDAMKTAADNAAVLTSNEPHFDDAKISTQVAAMARMAAIKAKRERN